MKAVDELLDAYQLQSMLAALCDYFALIYSINFYLLRIPKYIKIVGTQVILHLRNIEASRLQNVYPLASAGAKFSPVKVEMFIIANDLFNQLSIDANKVLFLWCIISTYFGID